MKIQANNIIRVFIFLFIITCVVSQSYAQEQNDDGLKDILGFKLNTSDLVNDINQEANDHKPHGEYRYYVISGVFSQLSNAKGFVQTYRGASDGEVFIFKEPGEKYYVCVDGPLTLENAKQQAAKLNAEAATNKLSNGNVWIFTK